ncbi:MAG: cation:proton antiporter [Chloroflexi bacterium]|nr:cation:proton antiporter [Chloroflexota bacterium]
MSEVLQLFLVLGTMIAIAKFFGYISVKLGQSAVLGELITGIILGPSVIDLLGFFEDGQAVEHTIIEFAEVGVLFLMFMAGLEIDLQNMLRVAKTAVLAGALGVLSPLIMLGGVSFLFGYSAEVSVFIGLILAATSVSISAQVMLELGVLESREGLALLGAAVIDDILVILLISLFIAINPGDVVQTAESRPIWEVLIRVAGFLMIGTALGWWLLPRIANLVDQLPISEGALVVAVVSALLMGFAADYFGGVAAITGSFIAGASLGQSRQKVVENIETGLHSVNYGLLVPVFFVSIGLQTDLTLVDAELLPLAALLTVVSIVSKVSGAGLGSALTGFNRPSAVRVGIGMISRGEVGLIVASIGITSGIIEDGVFAVIVFVVVLTTLVTPPLVRWSFAQEGVFTPANQGSAD